ncbi:Ig-like domain-containing protein [Salinimicrobium oceani]|uniref:Ig-like domain-containing protein n=1 Tax=Salinimicrobium oceani TaxID=2722702 RepID=A0ABX1D2L5_9FLAO|nr:Ig-like domain-containing protein [Salinimicrobium oceani]NJW52928.1 Ig-like domain-containing protein [Salinimicrobium oceani]
MKRHAVRLMVVLSLFSSSLSCAKRGTPDGGPLDEEAPRYVRARPENFTTNFDAREIRIYFDEYVKLTDPQRQIIISPPMDPRPEITPLGTASRSIRIRINDTLQPRTTYTINFGRSITDNNEGNPLSFFTYAFSTGPYIDSLSLRGQVRDALLMAPDPYISVMLYEVDSTYTDSVVYTQVPRYVTNTLDSATTFQLNNLKEGTYQLVGMRDVNNNYTFDPQTDKIAFAEELITLPTEEEFDLTLFKELLEGSFERPQQKNDQHLIFGYRGLVLADSVSISALDVPEGFESRITKDVATDTLHYWYKPNLERDTLKFVVATPRRTDTLIARLKTMKKDTLQFTFEPTSGLGLNQPLKIKPSTPLTIIQDSLVKIVDQDTLSVPFTASYDQWNNEYLVNFSKTEKQTYRVTALPGAFTDFFGRENDTLRSQVRTPALADLGNLVINLLRVEEFPVIVQLTSEKGEVAAERYSTGRTSLNFDNIKPGNYFLRLIYDRNENEQWDTGSFLGRQQPEEVVYFPELINVRANWDVSQPFDVSQTRPVSVPASE